MKIVFQKGYTKKTFSSYQQPKYTNQYFVRVFSFVTISIKQEIKTLEVKEKKKLSEIIIVSATPSVLQGKDILSYNFMLHIYMYRCYFFIKVKCN